MNYVYLVNNIILAYLTYSVKYYINKNGKIPLFYKGFYGITF